MTNLADLLATHHGALVDQMRHEAAGLARYETPEDLAQGVHERALTHKGRFEWRGEDEFRGWLRVLGQRHIADRHAYWGRIKRNAGRVARLGAVGSSLGGGEPTPAATATGPSTFAERRELLVLCAKALAALPARDQDLLRWRAEGVPVEEQAARTRMTYAAAQRAGLRALDRLRKAFELIRRG